MSEGLIVVETTVSDRQAAERLARELVERRLAACVQLSAISSIYRWQGEVESVDEVLLRIKSSLAARSALVAAIEELHCYENPEIVITGAAAGAAYGEWVEAETR